MAADEPKTQTDAPLADQNPGERAEPSVDSAEKAARLGVALHEISNSLTAVLGWLDTAARSVDGDAKSAIVSAMTRVRQAHRTARRAIGAQVSDEPPRPLTEIVEEVVRALAGEASRRGAKIDWQLFPDLRHVVIADGDRLSRVLTNLILNAVQHSGPGNHVRIVGDTAQAGYALLSVTDEGPGVPEELRSGLFDEKVSGRQGGAGIGLAHAAELARASSASIRFVSSQRGAHFAVTWPFLPPSARIAPTLPPQQGRAGYGSASSMPPMRTQTTPPVSGTLMSMRLLLVEDDLAISEMLRGALTARGAMVRVVARRSDLEQALEEATYQGILLDLSPIAEDVAGVLAAVHANNPTARLIMISGSVEGLPKLPPEIVIIWVQKPFELEDVVRALTEPPASLQDTA